MPELLRGQHAFELTGYAAEKNTPKRRVTGSAGRGIQAIVRRRS